MTDPAIIRKRVDALRAIDLFAQASEDELASLAAKISEREVSPGAAVVREGYLPTHVHVIESGEFEVVSRGETGETSTVNVLGPGAYFGEIGLIEGMPATATVRSKGSSRVYAIPGEAFLAFVDETASLTEVAGRIESWLARTHPSYRPSVAGQVSDADEPLSRAVGRLSDAERSELIAALGRLGSRAPEERLDQLRRLGH